jgi:hypothetical protein
MISSLERSFDQYAHLAELPASEPEYRFAAAHVGLGPGLRGRLAAMGLRDWRFDRAFLKERVYVELQGGVYTVGRHTRGAGYTSDLEKANVATLLGWRGLFFTSQMLKADPMGCMEKVRSLLNRRLLASHPQIV